MPSYRGMMYHKQRELVRLNTANLRESNKPQTRNVKKWVGQILKAISSVASESGVASASKAALAISNDTDNEKSTQS